jgi:valacyclovir hydrolase
MAWFEHVGSRIYYEDTGSGVPVLLLPGVTGSISNHATLRDLLARRYRVIAADLPGSGKSFPQPRSYGTSYYENDARAFAALLWSLGAVPAHLVGHSDGGEVALLIAAMWPGDARSVLAWGSAGAIADPTGTLISDFRSVFDAPKPHMEDYRTYLIESYGEDTARKTINSVSEAWQSIVAAGGDISRAIANRITCPVYLIVGQHDQFVSKAGADELARLIRRAETVEVAAAGHGVHDEKPQWFLETVSGWLDRH